MRYELNGVRILGCVQVASPFNNVGLFVCCMINYLNKIPVCNAVGIQGWQN